MTRAPLLELLLYLALGSLIVIGGLVLGWIISRERRERRDD